jgi:cyclophilin family peptidyl-prolyl cis-trans isomerase
VVSIASALGPIEVELFDAVAPLTVANFLGYADSNAYDQSFIHRSVLNFVIQGGGYKLNAGALPPIDVATSPPTVPNEFHLSNLRGTVAMARKGGLPDSATTQWFINEVDNTFLDGIDGGFTVFGEVISGMPVSDAINALPIWNAGGVYSEIPLINYVSGPIVVANLVVLSDVARKIAGSCGDLDGDGQIGSLDVGRIRGFLAKVPGPTGDPLSSGEASHCSVVGTATDCTLLDATILRRRLAGRQPKRLQICPAAL